MNTFSSWDIFRILNISNYPDTHLLLFFTIMEIFLFSSGSSFCVCVHVSVCGSVQCLYKCVWIPTEARTCGTPWSWSCRHLWGTRCRSGIPAPKWSAGAQNDWAISPASQVGLEALSWAVLLTFHSHQLRATVPFDDRLLGRRWKFRVKTGNRISGMQSWIHAVCNSPMITVLKGRLCGGVPFNSVLERPLKLGTQEIFITMLKKCKVTLSCAFFWFCFF